LDTEIRPRLQPEGVLEVARPGARAKRPIVARDGAQKPEAHWLQEQLWVRLL
jgi:hypothetical protein